MDKSSDTPRHPLGRAVPVLLIALFAGFLQAGCGDSSGTYDGSPPPDYASMLAGSPPPLANLHEQENELLEGGVEAFDRQMADLEGFPAVVNVWASWCGPCRAEFPHFQDAAAELGQEVAFFGIDSEDDNDAAATLLELNPVPYPSFIDQNRDIAEELDLPRGLPATLFFDANGKKTFLRQGGYPSVEELKEDIQTYAVDGGQG